MPGQNRYNIPFTLRNLILSFIFISLLASCHSSKEISSKPASKPGIATHALGAPLAINRNEFVKYAKTFLGTPYLYGSANPQKGLDCSGFVLNVFSHFKVKAPRVTKDYTYEGKEVSIKNAKPGDIILFTGSNHASGIVGHMGIITENGSKLQFIHAATSKNIGVILSYFEGYYQKHFVKIIQVLE